MNGDLSFRYDPSAWTFVPRVWPNDEFRRSARRWAKTTARAIEERSATTTREQHAWLRASLERLATMPNTGEAALYLYLREIGSPFLMLQVLPIEATTGPEEATAQLLRLDEGSDSLREPDAVRRHTARGLGVGSRGEFATDDGEGGEQVAVLWVFQSGGTDVRISTVANSPEYFAVIEPEVDEFIDGITVIA